MICHVAVQGPHPGVRGVETEGNGLAIAFRGEHDVAHRPVELLPVDFYDLERLPVHVERVSVGVEVSQLDAHAFSVLDDEGVWVRSISRHGRWKLVAHAVDRIKAVVTRDVQMEPVHITTRTQRLPGFQRHLLLRSNSVTHISHCIVGCKRILRHIRLAARRDHKARALLFVARDPRKNGKNFLIFCPGNSHQEVGSLGHGNPKSVHSFRLHWLSVDCDQRHVHRELEFVVAHRCPANDTYTKVITGPVLDHHRI
mmetsp:Transcript_33310/g.61937  ORF Transcript_33310/g.61937 Transcript_33310/m.61937 type:complete len:255 (-) Transcript_33310:796-1560(-)